MSYLFQDWQTNQQNSFKARVSLALFRWAQASNRSNWRLLGVGLLARVAYQFIVEWFWGIEIPWNTRIGRNLQIKHGQGLVVHNRTVIGENCILRHCTTLGNKYLPDGRSTSGPKIGNNVDIGANVVIIGPIEVGDYATIGAGSVVVKDIPAGAVVVGNPAKVIRIMSPHQQ